MTITCTYHCTVCTRVLGVLEYLNSSLKYVLYHVQVQHVQHVLLLENPDIHKAFAILSTVKKNTSLVTPGFCDNWLG